jgi:hypothetical protein
MKVIVHKVVLMVLSSKLIATNVLRIADVANLEAQMFNLK